MENNEDEMSLKTRTIIVILALVIPIILNFLINKYLK